MNNQSNNRFDEQSCKKHLRELGVGKKENRNGYTLKELSDIILAKTGISISSAQLSNLTSDTQPFNPSSEILVALATFFDVSTDYLLGLTDSKSKDIVEQEMNKKYKLSDKAMENLARWKKSDKNTYIFSEFKILQAIMEDEYFLTDLSGYFFEHFELHKEIPNDETMFRKSLRNILAGVQFLFSDFVEKIYNKLINKPSSDNRLVKYPHRKWGKDNSLPQE